MFYFLFKEEHFFEFSFKTIFISLVKTLQKTFKCEKKLRRHLYCLDRQEHKYTKGSLVLFISLRKVAGALARPCGILIG